MKPVARGAFMLTLLPASVEWIRLKLEDRGVVLTARSVQRTMVALEHAGLVTRDVRGPTLTRWRRAR